MSATWPTVEFAGSADVAPVTLHASLRDALAAFGWTSHRANPGAVDVADLQRLIAPAVRLAAGHLGLVMDAARTAVSGRVEQWSQRLSDWTDEADAMIQRRELQTTRTAVEQERGYTDAMNPDRQLVRPMLVVVPETQGA